MNISMLFSTPMPPREGIGFYCTNLARELTRQGHRVTLVTRGQGLNAVRSERDGYQVIEAPFLPAYPFHIQVHGWLISGLLRDLEAQTDVWHLHSPLVPVPHTRKPVVATIHTPMKADGRSIENVGLHALLTRLQTPFSAMAEAQLFRRANRMTAVAKSVVLEMQEYGITPDQVEILGNGTDAEFFAPDGRAQPAQSTFLYAGRLAHRKGLFDLVEATKILVGSMPNVRVQLAGSGPLEAPLRAKVAEYGLGGHVEFLGHVGTRDALREAYRNATAYIQPSHYEGLPTSLLEAMSTGRACIATNVSGHPDVIEHGVNGLLVEAQQPEALAGMMRRVAGNASEAQALGRAARATILERFTWPQLTQAYLKVYEQSLSQTGSVSSGLHRTV